MRARQFVLLLALVLAGSTAAAFFGAYHGALAFYQAAAKADVTAPYGGSVVQSVTCGSSGNLSNIQTVANPSCDLIASPSVTSIITGLTGTGLQQASNDTQTSTNASPSLLTLTGWNAKITSGSAVALVFTITYAHIYTNPPSCIFMPAATFTPVMPTVVSTTTTCTLTFTAAPTAVLLGTLTVLANGP